MKTSKRLVKTIILTILAMVFGMLLSMGAEASGKPEIVTKRVYIYEDPDYLNMYDDEYEDLYVKLKNIPQGAKIVRAEISNEKVLDGIVHDAGYDKNMAGGGWQIILMGKKPGKSKLTITYKTLKGKTKKLSKTITVIKYPNPVKSVSVDGEKIEIEKGIADCEVDFLKNETGSAKVKVQLNSGWTIIKNKSYVNYSREIDEEAEEESLPSEEKKKFKNGMTVSKQNANDEIEIVLMMKKGKQTATYCIWFD